MSFMMKIAVTTTQNCSAIFHNFMGFSKFATLNRIEPRTAARTNRMREQYIVNGVDGVLRIATDPKLIPLTIKPKIAAKARAEKCTLRNVFILSAVLVSGIGQMARKLPTMPNIRYKAPDPTAKTGAM